MDKIEIYTDGSALSNGKENSRCGWAYKVIYQGHQFIRSGSDIGKTNNQMEMTAVLKALTSIKDKNIPVTVYSDSKYVIETIKGKFKINKNIELWQLLMLEKDKFSNICFMWVKGHDKNQHNNDVDQRAVEEARKVELY